MQNGSGLTRANDSPTPPSNRSVKAREALLTNYEVLQVCTEVLKRASKNKQAQEANSNVTTIAYEVCLRACVCASWSCFWRCALRLLW